MLSAAVVIGALMINAHDNNEGPQDCLQPCSLTRVFAVHLQTLNIVGSSSKLKLQVCTMLF